MTGARERGEGPKFPRRKISETFLEFLQPLIDVMNDPDDEAEIQSVLKLGFTVWNAVVLADVYGKRDYLSDIAATIVRVPSTGPLVTQLVERKRARYGEDHRLIGNYRLKTKKGELRLEVEARGSIHRIEQADAEHHAGG